MFDIAPLSKAEHTSRPWRIHALPRSFRVLDVWALPTPGGPDDFPRLVQLMAEFDPAESSIVCKWPVRDPVCAWARVRPDRPETGLGVRVPSFVNALPAESGSTPQPISVSAPITFRPLYVTDDEFALEIANQTIHGVMHVGWVPDGAGGYRGQMAVLVKPNGLLGSMYMVAIAPFRYLAVYPLMLRDIGRMWRESVGATMSGEAIDSVQARTRTSPA